MTNSARRPRVLIGLVLLVVGVVALVDNLSDWDFLWGDWWPVILIAIGVSKLVRRKPSWVGGATITGLGVIFLLDTLDIWGFSIGDIWRFWPVLLVVVGVSILLGGRKARSRHRDTLRAVDDSRPGELNISCVFGETNRSITDRNFSGGEVTTVFGNTRINLADTVLASNEATINVTVVCGGVTFRVPGSWAVDMQATTIFADVTDNRARPLPEDGQERVTITGACLFSQIVLES